MNAQKIVTNVTQNWSVKGQHSTACLHTMTKNLLNCCYLVSISKNVVFYVFGLVMIY